MITKETCVKIWNAYQQVENCQKLLEDMGELLKKDKEKKSPTLYDAFGERRGLQLGVPSGDDSHRIFGVSPELGLKIIEEHISNNKRRLAELETIAKLELYHKDVVSDVMLGERCELSDDELVSNISNWVSKLCNSNGKAWVLQVPANPNQDPDILITELLSRFRKMRYEKLS